MILTEMHKWFRQYAQQMGMQNVRAILPEQIDTFINTSIVDFVNELVRTNIGITNDRVITDNSKIGNINALRSLYRVVTVPIESSSFIDSSITLDEDNISTYLISNHVYVSLIINGTSYQICDITSLGNKNYLYNAINGSHTLSNDETIVLSCVDGVVALVNTTFDDIESVSLKTSIYNTTAGELIYNFSKVPISICDLDVDGVNSGKFTYVADDVMFWHDFSVNYKKATGGIYKTAVTHYPTVSGAATNLFPIRIIEDQYLADVLQDFILKPSLRSPVLTIHDTNTDDDGNTTTVLDFYFGTPKGGIKAEERGTTVANAIQFENNLVPYQLRISYIKTPNKVIYNEDQLANNVNCDLPESTHIDILKHAVDLYRMSIQGSMIGAQQQAQRQNQEIARNNARDEGYAPAQ